MVVLEKWVPKTNFCHLLRWRKERYYIKRFLVETENKEELIITEHPIHNWRLYQRITVR
jgi:topoisomerase-4 subunit A